MTPDVAEAAFAGYFTVRREGASREPCTLCDGHGQVRHGEGALAFVTVCPNGCGSREWDKGSERCPK
jgi:DnaJ-class molecular chaperone